MINSKTRITAIFSLLLLLITSCGGGGGSPPPAGSSSVKTSGVMTKGSAIVNGVRFTITAGTVSVDDNPSLNEDSLQSGMVVRVRGLRNDDGVTGTADAIETENEVQGAVESIDLVTVPNSIVVLGQTIFINDNTIFALPLTAISDISVADIVEVHGLRDAQGNLRASRIEDRVALGAGEAELKGVILGGTLTATTFEIGSATGTTQLVNFSAATIEPAGATIGEGDLVEVKGDQPGGAGTVLNALFVQREDLEDDEFDPVEGEEVEVEGFIAGFAGHPGVFQVDGKDVATTASTIFRLGSEEDLLNGVKVEAEGHISAGVLTARKITFKNQRVEIEAEVTASSSTSLTVMGQNDLVAIAPFTDIQDPVVDTQRYRIRGFDDGGTIIAERIEVRGGGDDWLKALVEVKDEGLETLTFLSGNIVANLATNLVFQDTNDDPILETEFYAGITAGSTSVKVKFSSGTFTVVEASLED